MKIDRQLAEDIFALAGRLEREIDDLVVGASSRISEEELRPFRYACGHTLPDFGDHLLWPAAAAFPDIAERHGLKS